MGAAAAAAAAMEKRDEALHKWTCQLSEDRLEVFNPGDCLQYRETSSVNSLLTTILSSVTSAPGSFFFCPVQTQITKSCICSALTHM